MTDSAYSPLLLHKSVCVFQAEYLEGRNDLIHFTFSVINTDAGLSLGKQCLPVCGIRQHGVVED